MRRMYLVNLTAAVFFAALYNFTFFKKVSDVYSGQPIFILSVFVVFVCLLYLVLSLITVSRNFKLICGLLFFLSAFNAYSTDTFGTIVDQQMLLNLFSTDGREIADLFNFRLAAYVIILGFLPSLVLFKIRLPHTPWRSELKQKLIGIPIAVLLIIVTLFSQSKTYSSFFREHKPLRMYTVPTYMIYSVTKYIGDSSIENAAVATLGEDAKIPKNDIDRELVIFVLGETARADRFSLNGYAKDTNPLLSKRDVFSVKSVKSCGTSTATSVPCMFSIFGQEEFTLKKAATSENLLDVLHHTGRISVLWRDNNSDSKGVANRVAFEDFRHSDTNPECDIECRDIGMLSGLQEYIDKQTTTDVFIVLHQMGNHGPAYFKRYPKQHEFFKPACQSMELGSCSNIEIDNAYDNAIRYTDYFLNAVIDLLEKNNSKFNTVLFYASDHGESLGENSIYLHGLPNALAPIEQTHVPLIMWFGPSMKKQIDLSALSKATTQPFSHDNIFHTVLGLMEVETKSYDAQKDIIKYVERL
jgi:lipid A ethanolaminephosphotransferase